MSKSSIEWTGATWNPIRARNQETERIGTHCVKISPGCAHCYAEAHNSRLLPHGSSGLPYTKAGAELAEYLIDPEKLAEPLRRRKPETYFVCSMTDLFMYPLEMVARVYAVMAATRHRHTFQVLTKRPDQALKFCSWLSGAWNRTGSPLGALKIHAPREARDGFDAITPWPLRNVWLGVSVEDHKHGLPRIDILRQLPAALRFLSIEPLLEDLGEIDLSGIGWVIVGGESGRVARPMHPDWVRSIRDQCASAGVPFFFKQWGAWAPGALNHGWRWVTREGRTDGHPSENPGAEGMSPVGKGKAGHLLDGWEWREMPVVARG